MSRSCFISTRVLLFLSVSICLMPRLLHAMQIISPTEGETTFIEISQKDLNVIKTPLTGTKALSASRNLDIRVEGKNVFVKYTGMAPEPQELILTDEDGDVYPLVLKPAGIPAETIVLRVKEEKGAALGWERSHDYVKSVKELVKGLHLGTPPKGYATEELDEDRTEWKEVASVLKKRYTGAMLVGEIFALKAQSEEVTLDEKEFYVPGVLAVSAERHELKPGEAANLYVVRKR